MLKGKYTEICTQMWNSESNCRGHSQNEARHEQFVNNGVNFSDNEYYDYPSFVKLSTFSTPKAAE